nr:putative toxin-antitoxin system toxin component, PIN family [Stomatobaculum longum]
MKYFAVIDTNVLVSAVLKQKSVPGSIIELAFDGPITPVLNEDIEAEYRKVLLRPKFHLTEDIVNDIIDTFHQRGLYIDSEAIDIDLPDPKDRVFYEVVMEERKDEDAYLVTGNIRHFPTAPFIVTPRQMLDIILKDQEG